MLTEITSMLIFITSDKFKIIKSHAKISYCYNSHDEAAMTNDIEVSVEYYSPEMSTYRLSHLAQLYFTQLH